MTLRRASLIFGIGLIAIVFAFPQGSANGAPIVESAPVSRPLENPLLTARGRGVIDDVAAKLGTSDPEVILQHIAFQGTRSIGPDGQLRFDEWIEPNYLMPTASPQRVAPATDPGAKINSDLRAAMSAAGSAGRKLEVVVTLRRDAYDRVGRIQHWIDVGMVDGSVRTETDIARVTADKIAERVAEYGAYVDDFLREQSLDGTAVVRRDGASGVVTVWMTPSEIGAVSNRDDVAAIDVVREDEKLAGYFSFATGPSDGLELEDLIQSTQFYLDGYYGASEIAIIEDSSTTTGIYRAHQGFKSDIGAQRVRNCNPQGGTTCVSNPSPSPGTEHTTAVASAALGDLTLGQDISYTTEPEQTKRSGVARRATGIGVDTHDQWELIVPGRLTATGARADYVAIKSNGPVGDPTCTGTTGAAQAADTLFENGVALFQAMGDYSHVGDGTFSTDCTANSQSNAIGAFPVTAYQVSSSTDTPSSAEALSTTSSRGGTATEGGGRTLVGLAGPTNIDYAYHGASTGDPYSVLWPNGSGGLLGDTSGATPVVGGAAELFRQWWVAEVGTTINDPARLYTQMLLMGDRLGEGGGYRTSGFDGLWGAGKLRLRKYDSAGADAPWMFGFGKFCISNGATVTRDIHPNWTNVYAAVDIIKAVVWWYDVRLEAGIPVDNIDLKLQVNNSGVWSDVVTSATDDNRQRVFLGDAETKPYRLSFYGRDVTASAAGNCGAGQMELYWSSFMEDSARDDVSMAQLQYVRPE